VAFLCAGALAAIAMVVFVLTPSQTASIALDSAPSASG
jgi:hypothetical protein